MLVTWLALVIALVPIFIAAFVLVRDSNDSEEQKMERRALHAEDRVTQLEQMLDVCRQRSYELEKLNLELTRKL